MCLTKLLTSNNEMKTLQSNHVPPRTNNLVWLRGNAASSHPCKSSGSSYKEFPYSRRARTQLPANTTVPLFGSYPFSTPTISFLINTHPNLPSTTSLYTYLCLKLTVGFFSSFLHSVLAP